VAQHAFFCLIGSFTAFQCGRSGDAPMMAVVWCSVSSDALGDTTASRPFGASEACCPTLGLAFYDFRFWKPVWYLSISALIRPNTHLHFRQQATMRGQCLGGPNFGGFCGSVDDRFQPPEPRNPGIQESIIGRVPRRNRA